MTDLEQIGLNAVDKFIETWNSRDAQLWATSLNFPHVRPAPAGQITITESAEIYAANFDYQRVIDTGWDHSEWDYRHVIHKAATKIHVAGQWSRYNAAGEIIHTNPICYIVTRQDRNWGIQSRFAVDFVPEDDDTSGMETRSIHLIEDFISHFNQGNQAACAELLNYPHFTVGVGSIESHLSAADFKLPGSSEISILSLQSVQAGRLSLNAAVELAVRNDKGERTYQGVMNITNRDNHLGIQAWSLLDPDAPDPDDQ